MNITKQADGNKLILFLDGKLDTVTAPQLDAELKAAFEEYDTVEINMENAQARQSKQNHAHQPRDGNGSRYF